MPGSPGSGAEGRYGEFSAAQHGETTADAIKALSAVAEAVATGEISPGEGAEFGKLIDAFTRAIEASEFEERLSRLERATSK